MRAPFWGGMLQVLLAAVSIYPARAQNGPFTFEGYTDSTLLTSQSAGVVFTNTVVLAAGITLNEFEFPPHGGAKVVSDTAGPMTLSFSSGVNSFSGYFTYGVPLTVQAFDSSNHLVASTNSAYSNNEAFSGVSGSHANELLQVSSVTSIYKVVITGSPQGASFAMDDAGVISRCDRNQDGYTNVTDAQATVNQSLGAAAAADLRGNGVVNIVDVQIVINAALGLGCTVS